MQNGTLLEGSVSRGLLRFVLPILAGNLLQQLYNAADSLIVGQFVGETALGAMGTSQPIYTVMISLLVGLGVGMEILLGRYVGEKNHKATKQVLDTMFTFVMVMSIVVGIVGYFAVPSLLRLIRTQPEHMQGATGYLQIIFIGIPGIAGYNTLAGAIRASGNSKVPLIFLVICAVLHVVLDLVAVKGLNMGIQGAALATTISQLLSFLMCLYYINHHSIGMRYSLKKLDLSGQMLKQRLVYSVPASIQQGAMSVGMLLLQVIVNGLSAQAVTAYTIASKIDSFASVPITNLGQALSIFTSQNLGAGNTERVYEGKRKCLQWTYLICGGLLVILWLFGGTMAEMFGGTGETVEMVKIYLRILSLGYFVAGYYTVILGLIQGTGNTVVPMLINMISYWMVRLPVAWVLQRYLGFYGVCISIIACWILAFIATMFFANSKKFKRSLDMWGRKGG